MSKIPEYILCSTPELARQVLEKIERESDYLWLSLVKPTKHDVSKYNVPIVLHFDCKRITVSTERNFREYLGITNFTKAEDYLLSDETKIRLEELDNKLDKLINSDMTNKTWETLSEGDILISSVGIARTVLQVSGHLVCLNYVGCEPARDTIFSKDELIGLGYKIKGASEDKPSIDEVISLLKSIDCGGENNLLFLAINKAVEMLKKIKHYESRKDNNNQATARLAD